MEWATVIASTSAFYRYFWSLVELLAVIVIAGVIAITASGAAQWLGTMLMMPVITAAVSWEEHQSALRIQRELHD